MRIFLRILAGIVGLLLIIGVSSDLSHLGDWSSAKQAGENVGSSFILLLGVWGIYFALTKK